MKKRIAVLIAVVLCMVIGLSAVAIAVDDSQILVTKEYFDSIISKLATKEYVDTTVSTSTSSGGSSDEYIVLEALKSGQIVVGGSSTEMILRTGAANAYIPSTAGGGISDLTGGADITNGKAISKNHLLLFPRDDGRALKVTKDNTYIMVKGEYTIQ